MTQSSFPWSGTVTGDGVLAPYSEDEWSDLWSVLFQYNRAVQGVIPTSHTGYTGKLEVTTTGGAVVRVPSGAALVDGKVYLNTANVDNNTSGNTVYWLCGLTKNFAAQTVRVFLRGSYATRALALAALVQNDGVTWEIPLATVLTDASGNVDTITDERAFVLRPEVSAFLYPPSWWDGDALGMTWDYGAQMPTAVYSEAKGNCIIPKDYLPGSTITIKAVFSIAVGAGNVYIKSEIERGPINGDFSSEPQASGYSAVAVPGSGQETKTALTITLSAVTYTVLPGDYIWLHFERDGTSGSDTFAGTIQFHGWLMEYTPIS